MSDASFHLQIRNTATRRNTSAWLILGLVAADGKPGDQFGGKVAISGDAAVVGARLVDNVDRGVDSGAVYIFTGLLDVGDDES